MTAAARVETAPSGRIVRVDPAICALTGRGADELVGNLRFVDVLTGGSKIFYEMRRSPLLSLKNRLTDVILDLLRPDGAHLSVLVNGVRELTPSGDPRLMRFEVLPTEA